MGAIGFGPVVKSRFKVRSTKYKYIKFYLNKSITLMPKILLSFPSSLRAKIDMTYLDRFFFLPCLCAAASKIRLLSKGHWAC